MDITIIIFIIVSLSPMVIIGLWVKDAYEFCVEWREFKKYKKLGVIPEDAQFPYVPKKDA